MPPSDSIGLLTEAAFPPPPTSVTEPFVCPWSDCDWRETYTAVLGEDGRMDAPRVGERVRLAAMMRTHLQNAHGGYLPGEAVASRSRHWSSNA